MDIICISINITDVTKDTLNLKCICIYVICIIYSLYSLYQFSKLIAHFGLIPKSFVPLLSHEARRAANRAYEIISLSICKKYVGILSFIPNHH